MAALIVLTFLVRAFGLDWGILAGMLRSGTVFIALSVVLCVNAAGGLKAQAGGRARTFDVVSIRPNGPSERAAQSSAPTPNGYHMTGLGFGIVLLTAYVPQSGHGLMYAPDNIMGIPDWAWSERYEIDARISDADRGDWQDPKKQPEMLREMLQAMLADRFHLVAHRELRPQSIYSLQAEKGGPKFQESKPDERHPGAVALPAGGFTGPADENGRIRFYDLTMANFAAVISNLAGRTVRDDTGLTGRYDLVFQKPSRTTVTPADGGASDPGPTIFSSMQELGLKLAAAKGETEVLVVDHVERPTPN